MKLYIDTVSYLYKILIYFFKDLNKIYLLYKYILLRLQIKPTFNI
jgi:hypothetical protein